MRKPTIFDALATELKRGLSLDEVSTLVAEGAPLADAHAYLLPRSKRPESRPALRAAAWIEANPLPQAKPARKQASKPAPKPAPAKVDTTPRLSDGTAVTTAAWAAKQRREGNYRALLADIARLETLHAAHAAYLAAK